MRSRRRGFREDSARTRRKILISAQVDDDELRLHIETSVEAVEAFEKTKLFTEATERDRYLWNFHSHHEAVYPSSDSQLELFMQLFWYVRVVWPLFYLGFY